MSAFVFILSHPAARGRETAEKIVAREPQLCWEHEPEKEEWARERRERQREQARKRALGYP